MKPNILDIKLGTVMHDEGATVEKLARMGKSARKTASLATGVRITGFQVHNFSNGTIINTPREYGKSLAIADLPQSLVNFFPIAPSASQPIPPEGSTWTTVPSITPTNGTGLPPATLSPILTALRRNISEIRDALALIEMRMVGASILVIYEADWARAEEGLRLLGQPAEDDGEEDEDSEDDESKAEKVGPPYIVKVIDFAHTRIKPGEGADEGVLKGVDTILGLLDGRIKEVNAAFN